jgi:tether containing UBX domain for GLUT4
MGGKGGKESLNDLGLVPQSVLMVKWDDESMNGMSTQNRYRMELMVVTGYPAPLLDELMEKVVPLPAPEVKEGEVAKQPAAGGSGSGGSTGEKKIPK